MTTIDAGRLLAACADDGFDDGIQIRTELEPIGGLGSPVKPAVYEGGRYQCDRRWPDEAAEEPVDVVVIDNVAAQANRLETALRRVRASAELPELILDLSGLGSLPAHLPRTLSSFDFPHRNADAYLRDAELDGTDFASTEIGRSVFDATPWSAGALVAWFPQALLFGYWQSHLGKKRQQTKHARAWSSEIVGWRPATTETRVMGLKGDPLNLNVDEPVLFDEDDLRNWPAESKSMRSGTKPKKDKLSEIGHGQVPFMGSDAAPAGVSFDSITQNSYVSFAQLRRIGLGGAPDADAAARALLVALGLVGHVLAFGRGFSLRSGADLRPQDPEWFWRGATGDEEVDGLGPDDALDLLSACRRAASDAGVSLDGWGRDPLVLTPKANLRNIIESTWPEDDE